MTKITLEYAPTRVPSNYWIVRPTEGQLKGRGITRMDPQLFDNLYRVTDKVLEKLENNDNYITKDSWNLTDKYKIRK